MKSSYIVLISVFVLSACGTVPNTRIESPAPIVDAKTIPVEKLPMFRVDTAECRKIQQKAMPVSLLEALGTRDVEAYNARRSDQASHIMRECLRGRGYAVLN